MYKGGAGQYAYIFHRISGLAILAFLFTHILDTIFVRVNPDLYNKLVKIYAQPWFKPFDILLASLVLFHALNGIRIIIIDFFDLPSRYHKPLFTAVVVLFFILMIPGAYVLLTH